MPSTTGTLSAPGDDVTLTYTNEANIQVEISGTYAGLTVVFEFSPDDDNYFGILGNTPGQPIPVSQYTFAEDETRFFQFPGTQNGLYFRVRAVAIESGTADVAIDTV